MTGPRGWALVLSLQVAPVDERLVDSLRGYLERERRATASELKLNFPAAGELSPALFTLAQRGQLLYDLGASCYRFRPILPVELSEQVLGPPPEEQREGQALVGHTTIERQEALDHGKRLFIAQVKGTHCEALFDTDGQVSRARCSCSHFYRFKLRAGPCRHLLALRLFTQKNVPIQQ